MKKKNKTEPLEMIEEIEEFDEINLLTEDDPAEALKKGISQFVDKVLGKAIARVEDLGEYADIEEIEAVISRSRRRQKLLSRTLTLALGVLIVGCAVSISISIARFLIRQSAILYPLKRVEYLMNEGRPEKAVRVLNRLNFSPEQKKRTEKAIYYYVKIADHFYMTPGLVRGGSVKRAAIIYEEVLRKFPTISDKERANLHFKLGRCYEKLSIYQRAIESYSKTVELLPAGKLAEEAMYRMCLSHLNNESFEEARESLLAFVEEFPESMLAKNAYYRIGDAYLKQAEVLAAHISLTP